MESIYKFGAIVRNVKGNTIPRMLWVIRDIVDSVESGDCAASEITVNDMLGKKNHRPELASLTWPSSV